MEVPGPILSFNEMISPLAFVKIADRSAFAVTPSGMMPSGMAHGLDVVPSASCASNKAELVVLLPSCRVDVFSPHDDTTGWKEDPFCVTVAIDAAARVKVANFMAKRTKQ